LLLCQLRIGNARKLFGKLRYFEALKKVRTLRECPHLRIEIWGTHGRLADDVAPEYATLDCPKIPISSHSG